MAGAAAGIFLGSLIGLSASPIVNSVIAPIFAIVTAVLAYQLKRGATENTTWDAPFLAALFLGSCASLPLALMARSHNWLGADVDHVAMRDAWVAIGFTQEEAREIALFEMTGIQLSLIKQVDSNKAAKTSLSLGALFAAKVSVVGLPADMKPDEYKTSADTLGAWEDSEHNSLSRIAKGLSSLSKDVSEKQRAALLEAIWTAMQSGQTLRNKISELSESDATRVFQATSGV